MGEAIVTRSKPFEIRLFRRAGNNLEKTENP
jgi:hypothetical protein